MTTTVTPTQPAPDATAPVYNPKSESTGAKRAKSTIFHIAALVLTCIVLYPALWMIASAFKPNSEIGGANNASLWSNNFSFDNFATAMDGIGGVSTLQFFTNSLILAIGAVVGTVLSASVSAYAFARIKFPGREHVLRHDDRHPAAALPRGDHPAVHHLPAAGPGGHLRAAADRQVPRRGRVLRLPHGPVHAQPPRRTRRSSPHRRRRTRPDLHLHHAAR